MNCEQTISLTTVSKNDKDNQSHFWESYAQVAEEHDSNFLERCSKDMYSILLFVGLAYLSSISLVFSPLSAHLSLSQWSTANHTCRMPFT